QVTVACTFPAGVACWVTVPRKTSWPPSSVSVPSKTSPDLPPASHGRAPAGHWGVPATHVWPPSWETKRASLARSMPVFQMLLPASSVSEGSLKPVYAGLVTERVQVRPPSLENQLLTWLS